MRRVGFNALLSLLTIAVALIAGRIEWLNARAGWSLPSHEYRDGDPAAGPVAWRQSSVTTEARWRRFNGPKDAAFRPVTRPLTADEQRQVRSDLARTRAGNDLLALVETAGLLQYLLVPVLLGGSVAVLLQGGVRRGGVPLAVAIVAAALMVYRGYYASLGS